MRYSRASCINNIIGSDSDFARSPNITHMKFTAMETSVVYTGVLEVTYRGALCVTQVIDGHND